MFVIIALESSGIPLPGEATLISAAIYAATTHELSLPPIIVWASAGAIVGDNVGFRIGRTFGLPLLLRTACTSAWTGQRHDQHPQHRVGALAAVARAGPSLPGAVHVVQRVQPRRGQRRLVRVRRGAAAGLLAGIWTAWTSVRKVREGEVTADLYGFLTTTPNAEVGAIHPKAMPVILTTAEQVDAWMTVPWKEAAALQRPLPDEALTIVARGAKKDGDIEGCHRESAREVSNFGPQTLGSGEVPIHNPPILVAEFKVRSEAGHDW